MRIFNAPPARSQTTLLADLAVVFGVCCLLSGGIWMALGAPAIIKGPDIVLAPSMLPRYTAYSVGRMLAAYALSLVFSLVYGTLAARHRLGETVLLPVLDVLQSVPILSFLPVVLLSLSAFLPEDLAVEIASVVLIFTSQVWNMTFAWYQAQTTIPGELREASAMFRFNGLMRFRTLDLPFAAVSLIWNSVMSWAGGWFFLMAAEIFSVGHRDFRLPGLGSYLQEAAVRGDSTAILWGLGAIVAVIVGLDQLVWRPLLAWGERFKLAMVTAEEEPTSWFHDLLLRSRLVGWLRHGLLTPLSERLDTWSLRRFPATDEGTSDRADLPSAWPRWMLRGLMLAVGLYLALHAVLLLRQVPLQGWADIAFALIATFLRVLVALCIAIAWTLPAGVFIGSSPRAARVLQPLVQIAASIPATAIFPVVLMFLVNLTHGLNLAAILLMLMGTQWYLLFNIIAGASTIPQDLKDTSTLLGLSRWGRWRTLTLPALFPYIVTGAITASGGAWNASIVSEYVTFGGQVIRTRGIGAIIAQATGSGDYPTLLAGTLVMVLTVVLFNRFVWRRLYRLAEDKYRLE